MKLIIEGRSVAVNRANFPAGESLVAFVPDSRRTGSTVRARITYTFKGNDSLVELLLLTDAIRRHYEGYRVEITLLMPYFPYARQDRVCNEGESLSTKVIADLINSQGYAKVICYDLHSDVTAVLINNLVHRRLPQLASFLKRKHPDAILVSPDAGSNKKVFEFAKLVGFDRVVRADKTRDVKTGQINGTQVYLDAPLGHYDFLIVDDICDGGRTFIELAKQLRYHTMGRIYLYVTHGLFTKGYDSFWGLIDGIYTVNLMGEEDPLVTVVKSISEDV